MSRKQAILFMILASVCWSFAGLLIKQITWNPMVISGARSLIAGTFMLFFLKKEDLHFSKHIFLGGFCYVFVAGLFVLANKLTTSTNAILLQFTSPIWIVIFGALLWQEKPTKKDLIVVATVLFGMVLFFFGDLEIGGIIGNFAAIAAGMAVAFMIRVMQLDKDVNPLLMTIIGNYMLFIINIPFYFLYPPAMIVTNIQFVFILGVFQLACGYILFTKAVHYVSTLDAALLMVIEPLLNPIWVLLVLGEKPSIYALIGGVIVITTIVWSQISDLKCQGDKL